MNWIVLGGRVLLAAVFMTAAMGKFVDMPASRDALSGFGVSRRFVPAFAVLLPVAETVTAAALLFSQTARAGGAAALALLVIFMFGIARAMARGEAPDCNCFGQISSSPAGWSTLVRNALLAIPAILIVAFGVDIRLGRAITGPTQADVLLAAGVALILALAALAAHLGLARRQRVEEVKRLRESLAAFPPGLPVGASAPDFRLPDLAGGHRGLRDLLAPGHPLAIAFVSPSCISCRMMFPDLARWQRVLSDRITIAVIAAGDRPSIRKLADEFGLQNVLLQAEAEVFEKYRAAATPSVVIVSPSGQIATRIRSSAAIVEAVIRHELENDSSTAQQDRPLGDEDSVRVLQWNS